MSGIALLPQHLSGIVKIEIVDMFLIQVVLMANVSI